MAEAYSLKMKNMKKRAVPFICFILAAIVTMPAIAASADPSGDKLIVYYFHRTVRCPSCTLLEEITREAVRSGFAPELSARRIEFMAVNVDDAAHAHYLDDYSLSVQSVVLAEMENGIQKRWKKLDRVWALLHQEEQLVGYIQEEIRLSLKETNYQTGHKIIKQ